MKCPQQVSLILVGLALSIAGCDNPKEEAALTSAEKPASSKIKIGPPTTPGPIEPAPAPHLPYPGTPEAKELMDAKNAAKAAEAKAPETKPAEKPAEPKP